MGKLNDYANVLTVTDQRNIEEKVEQLNDKGIGLTVLVSKRNPFASSEMYASEIRSKWGLRTTGSDSLIVFVKQQDSWAVESFLQPDLTGLFTTPQLTELRNRLNSQVEDGEIRSAFLHLIDQIHRKAFPPAKSEEKPPPEGNGWSVINLIFGIVGGAVAILFFLWWEGKRRCPRCGNRLELNRTRNDFSGAEKHKSCPECGYGERL